MTNRLIYTQTLINLMRYSWRGQPGDLTQVGKNRAGQTIPMEGTHKDRKWNQQGRCFNKINQETTNTNIRIITSVSFGLYYL